MGQRPSFQRMIDSCFSQNGYARFLAAFWSIRMSWRLGSWGGLCPRQWKVSFTVSVSRPLSASPAFEMVVFLGCKFGFQKWPVGEDRLHLLGECGLIDLSSSASKSLSFWTYTPCVFVVCSTTWLVCVLSMKVDGILRILLSPFIWKASSLFSSFWVSWITSRLYISFDCMIALNTRSFQFVVVFALSQKILSCLKVSSSWQFCCLFLWRHWPYLSITILGILHNCLVGP